MKWINNEKGSLIYTLLTAMVLMALSVTVVTLTYGQVFIDRNSEVNRKANYAAQGAMDALNDFLKIDPANNTQLLNWPGFTKTYDETISADGTKIFIRYSHDPVSDVADYTDLKNNTYKMATYRVEATVSKSNHQATKVLKARSPIPGTETGGGGGGSSDDPASWPEAKALFKSGVVCMAKGDKFNSIADSDNPNTQMPDCNSSDASDFVHNFTTYFDARMEQQPLPLTPESSVAIPSGLQAGNKSFDDNSSHPQHPNQVYTTPQLYTGQITINNGWGNTSMTFGTNPGTLNTAVLYGGSCNFGGISKIVIYGDLVCAGDITFSNTITKLEIYGDIVAGGKININGNVKSLFVNNINSVGNVSFTQTIDDMEIKGEFISGGNINFASIKKISAKTISAAGDVNFNNTIDDALFTGDLIGKNFKFNAITKMKIDGNVSSTGNLKFSGTVTDLNIINSIYSQGETTFYSVKKLIIGGSVYSSGSIDLLNTLENPGLHVAGEMLSGDSITFVYINHGMTTGNFMGALNTVHFKQGVSGSLPANQLVKLGGIAAGRVTVDNNYYGSHSPPRIFINHKPPEATGGGDGDAEELEWKPESVP